MTVRDAIAYGSRRLAAHRCDGADAARETEALLANASRRTREELLARPERPLVRAAENRFRLLVARRRRHEPLAYLLGTAWFMGREFRVTPATLIPRTATESLVEAALEGMDGVRTVLDVGTGSGCIAVSLALALPRATVVATDTSPAALRVARANAVRHQVNNRVVFKKDDLLAPGALAGERALVVANLPYLPTVMWRTLSPDIRRFEPKSALLSGADGLDDSRRLLDQLADVRPAAGTRVVLEILPRQFSALAAHARRRFRDARSERIRNLADVVIGIRIDLP
jgi:release factor glutamine methyltransferase